MKATLIYAGFLALKGAGMQVSINIVDADASSDLSSSFAYSGGDSVSRLCEDSLLYHNCHRNAIDWYAQLRDAGVVGAIDTLGVARAVEWPPPGPTSEAGTKPHKLGACHVALGFGELPGAPCCMLY
jgi:hypothetical protein